MCSKDSSPIADERALEKLWMSMWIGADGKLGTSALREHRRESRSRGRPKPGIRGSEMIAMKRLFAACGRLNASRVEPSVVPKEEIDDLVKSALFCSSGPLVLSCVPLGISFWEGQVVRITTVDVIGFSWCPQSCQILRYRSSPHPKADSRTR
jgi:hypothetical protein